MWQQGQVGRLAVQLAMRLVLLELMVAEVLGHGHDRRGLLILMLAPQTLLLFQYAGVPLVLKAAFRERRHALLSEVEEGWLIADVGSMELLRGYVLVVGGEVGRRREHI